MRSVRRDIKSEDRKGRLLGGLDIALKLTSILAILIGGSWALYNFFRAGGEDWMINLDMDIRVMPYSDKLAIVSATLEATNPRDREVEFKVGDEGIFYIEARKVSRLKNGDRIDFTSGDVIQRKDFVAEDDYVMIPHGVMKNTMAMVVENDAIISLHAEVGRGDDTVILDRVVNTAAELCKTYWRFKKSQRTDCSDRK